MERVNDLGSSDAAVDDLVFWEILLESFPSRDARGADKQHRALGRRALLVGGFERRNLPLPIPAGLDVRGFVIRASPRGKGAETPLSRIMGWL